MRTTAVIMKDFQEAVEASRGALLRAVGLHNELLELMGNGGDGLDAVSILAGITWGVKFDAIRSGCKVQPVPLARWSVWRALGSMGWSSMKIAAAFGCDHGSVLYGVRRLKDRCALEPEVQRRWETFWSQAVFLENKSIEKG